MESHSETLGRLRWAGSALADSGFGSCKSGHARRPFFAINNRPRFFPRQLYKGRARIERTVGKLKRFKRFALRCEKTAQNYGVLVAFACGLILIKSVQTA